uniref:Uncharacterized protein n=1 Tax=Triticum urartu TaxID=4572 RepID=A0A8R7PSV1_TRIUA
CPWIYVNYLPASATTSCQSMMPSVWRRNGSEAQHPVQWVVSKHLRAYLTWSSLWTMMFQHCHAYTGM